MWLTVLGFMVMGLVSRLSQAYHSDLESFLVACTWLSLDGIQQEGFWQINRTYGLSLLSPFDLSQILLFAGNLLVSSSLPGPPIVRLTPASGYNQVRPGWVVSVSGSPNNYINLVINLYENLTNRHSSQSVVC